MPMLGFASSNSVTPPAVKVFGFVWLALTSMVVLVPVMVEGFVPLAVPRPLRNPTMLGTPDQLSFVVI